MYLHHVYPRSSCKDPRTTRSRKRDQAFFVPRSHMSMISHWSRIVKRKFSSVDGKGYCARSLTVRAHVPWNNRNSTKIQTQNWPITSLCYNCIKHIEKSFVWMLKNMLTLDYEQKSRYWKFWRTQSMRKACELRKRCDVGYQCHTNYGDGDQFTI